MGLMVAMGTNRFSKSIEVAVGKRSRGLLGTMVRVSTVRVHVMLKWMHVQERFPVGANWAKEVMV